MLMKSGNVRAIGAIVSLMSREELAAAWGWRGWQVSCGQLAAVDILRMPVLAEFWKRGMRLQEVAMDQLLRFTGTQALAGR
jgi:hypothetical protein